VYSIVNIKYTENMNGEHTQQQLRREAYCMTKCSAWCATVLLLVSEQYVLFISNKSVVSIDRAVRTNTFISVGDCLDNCEIVANTIQVLKEQA
jgi:hypothetical protein